MYSAPFVAPLTYVGVGLLLLLIHLEPIDSRAVGPWALFLSLGGFAGNFLLALLDHAQNAFFGASEWIPVVAAAFGCTFLGVALVTGERAMLRCCLWICGVEAIAGVLGFVLHFVADLRRPAVSLAARFLFGAPAFAPLLFADVAALAAVSLWAMLLDKTSDGAGQGGLSPA